MEQPHVFDGDDGLMREAGDEFDLLLGERVDFLTENAEGSDQFVIFEQRHRDKCANTCHLHKGDALGMTFKKETFGLHI